MSEVTQFYTSAHIFISFIGALLLLAIWFNIRKRFRKILEEEGAHQRVDKGLLYLSLSMFVWVLSGCWMLLATAYGLDSISWVEAVSASVFSTLNNLFLLLALFYFYYAPSFIANNVKNTKTIVWVIGAVALLIVVLSFLEDPETPSSFKLSGLPDLVLSGFLSCLLGYTLYKTFVKHQLPIVASISVVAIGLMFYSQLQEVFPALTTEFTNDLFKLIAKTSLIAIFLVLATTWVIRLAGMPRPKEVKIAFLDWSLVRLSIPSKDIIDQTIDFGSKTTQYKNLLKFAMRRKAEVANAQSIVVGSDGEIKNQTYLSRIIDNINEILALSDDQKLERRDVFTFIGQGKYRLRIVPENITIDAALAQEFCDDPENEEYASFCNSL